MVKAVKPRQDLRFDVPAVGPDTIAAMQAARCSALAIEADKALVLDRDLLAAAADRAGIAVEGLEIEPAGQGRDPERPAPG